MAEVAIAAAAVQFIDVGSRALYTLIRLCSFARDVPEQFRAAKRELTRFKSLAETLHADLNAPSTGPASSLAGVIPKARQDEAIAMLNDAKDQVRALNSVLESVIPTSQENRSKRVWRAIVSLKKEKEILERCKQLERLKSDLNTWCSHQSLILINNQILAAGRTESAIGTLDRRSAVMEGQLTAFRDDVRSNSDWTQSALSRAGSGIERLEQGVMPLRDQLASMEMQVRASTDSCQRALERADSGTALLRTQILSLDSQLETTKDTFQDAITQSTQGVKEEVHATQATLIRIEDLLRNRGQVQEDSPTPAQRGYRSAFQQTCGRLISKPSLMGDLLRETHPNRPGQWSDYLRNQPILCTCSPSRSRTSLGGQSLSIYYATRSRHRPECPLYRRSPRSWTFGVRAILPRLLARSIQVAFTANFGAGGFTLAFPNVAVARIVQRSKSPAFALLQTAGSELCALRGGGKRRDWGDEIRFGFADDLQRNVTQAGEVLDAIGDGLVELFELGEASPQDRDEDGSTYLDDVIRLCRVIWQVQSVLRPRINHLVRLLIDCDINQKSGHRICSMYNDATPMNMTLIELDKVLVANGFDVEDLTLPWATDYQTAVLWRAPELVLDFGLCLLSLAVVERSVSRLRDMIVSGYNVNGIRNDRPSPLILAIGWPIGMKILIEAGADLYPALFSAIRLRNYDALALLLDNDAPLFSFQECPGFFLGWGSVLRYALFCQLEHDGGFELILQSLIQRRRKLLALAQERLPFETQKELGLPCLGVGSLLDEHASSVVEALRQEGVDVPVSLEVGPQKTAYHDESMTPDAAAQLYAAGFHAIDAEDERGRTPLLLVCCYPSEDRSRMISWYLDKGAKPLKPHKNRPRTYLHALAGQGEWFELCAESVLRPLRVLCGSRTEDSCICYCSSSGCTPVTVLWKQNPGHCLPRKSWRLERWLQWGAESSEPRDACLADACRVEVFERLDMAHTCCRFSLEYGLSDLDRVTVTKTVSEAERGELREEDAETKDILESYMQLYADLRSEFSGPIPVFWKSWWKTLSRFLPERRRWRCPQCRKTSFDKDTEGPETSRSYWPDEEGIRAWMHKYLQCAPNHGVDHLWDKNFYYELDQDSDHHLDSGVGPPAACEEVTDEEYDTAEEDSEDHSRTEKALPTPSDRDPTPSGAAIRATAPREGITRRNSI